MTGRAAAFSSRGGGRVMCCLCFEYVPRSRLNVDQDGALEDVCVTCAGRERAHADERRRALLARLMRERFGK